jgi:hypothetical protein
MDICRTIRASLLLAALLAGARPGAAQDGDLPPEAAAPRYRVEFVLFAHNEIDPSEEEFTHTRRRPADSPVPIVVQPLFAAPRDATTGAADGANPADAAAPPSTGIEDDTARGGDPFETIDPFGQLGQSGANGAQRAGLRFRVLRSDELQLRDAFARIGRLGAYRALAHGGWVQDALDENAAQPMNIANLGVLNPTGTLRLHLSRFLHLTVDIQYQAGLAQSATEAGSGFAALSELALQPRYRILTQRRARSGELHYIDHPMFGLLFMITPAPEEPPVEDDTAILTPAA